MQRLFIRDFQLHAAVNDIVFQTVERNDLLVAAAIAEVLRFPRRRLHWSSYLNEIKPMLDFFDRLRHPHFCECLFSFYRYARIFLYAAENPLLSG